MEKCKVCGFEVKTTQALSGHMRLKHGREGKDLQVNEDSPTPKALVPFKALPVEALVDELVLPEIVDGGRQLFDVGVKYAMKSIIVGVRLAQELSAMGVQQAKPLMEMAKEMRLAEGQAAQVAAHEAAREAAAETATRVAEYFDQRKPDIATVPNPMQGVLARAMERMMDNLTERWFGGGQTQGTPSSLPEGWETKEVKSETFGGEP